MIYCTFSGGGEASACTLFDAPLCEASNFTVFRSKLGLIYNVISTRTVRLNKGVQFIKDVRMKKDEPNANGKLKYNMSSYKVVVKEDL
jgi:hypothetical protein